MSTNQLKIDGSGAWRTPFDVKPNHTYTLDLNYLNNGTEAGVINVINALSGSQIASFNLDGDAKSFAFTTDASTTLVKFYLGRTSTNAASYLVDNIMVKDITTVNPAAPQGGRLTKYKFDFNDGTAQGFVGVTGNNTATSSSLTLLVSGYQKNSITCSRVFNGLQGGTTYTVTFSIADAGPAYNTCRINVNQPNGTNIATITYYTPGIHDITFTLPAGLTSATFAISGERGLPYYSNVFNVDDVTLTYMGTVNTLQTASGYRFGFNGKEADNETYGTGNEYDYGFRVYNPRLGKFLSVDPLTDKYPELTPFQFASNRPIDGVDLDGAEYMNSTTIWSSTSTPSISGGIGYGVNLTLKTGTAYDMIGKTQFVAYSAVHPGSQNLEESSRNPKMIIGGEIAAIDGSVDIVHKPTFQQASEQLNLSFNGIELKGGLGLGFGLGDNSLGLSGGLGLGMTFKSGNQSSTLQSISLTYNEANTIGSKDWILGDKISMTDKEGNITGYGAILGTYNSEGKFVASNLRVYSGAISGRDKEGNEISESDGVWKSQAYSIEEQQCNK